jgi:hypothetical protein
MFDKQHNLMMNVQLNNDINQVKIVNDEIVKIPKTRTRFSSDKQKIISMTFSASRRRSFVIVLAADKNV